VGLWRTPSVWTRRRVRGIEIVVLTLFIVMAFSTAGAARPLTARRSPAHPLAFGRGATRPPAARSATVNPLTFVDPFVGSGGQQPLYDTGYGFASPSADMPFGMVQWGPDTTSGHIGGYVAGDVAIKGFSLTHLEGVGCPTGLDMPFMPTLASLSNTSSPTVDPAPFAHHDEQASPGFYSVRLGTGIKVALTVTTRTGFARLTYPRSAAASLVLNAGADTGHSRRSTIAVYPGARTMVASSTDNGFCNPTGDLYTIYIAVQFDKPIVADGVYPATPQQPAHAFVTFDTRSDRVVQARVGVSYVSARNALLNLHTESPTWDFAAVRAAAQSAWRAKLGRVEIHGGASHDKRTFYSALYHTLLHPNIFSDVDGSYVGFDGRTRSTLMRGGVDGTLPAHYTSFSGWDVYRSEIPLLALLAPAETSAMMQSLVDDAKTTGALPRWVLAGHDTGIMVGDPASLEIAGAYALGARQFDTGAALAAMVRDATDPTLHPSNNWTRSGLSEYLRYGYIPTDDSWVWGTAATTLEYAAADFALGRFAAALGRPRLAATFTRQSEGWRALFNPRTGFIQPRDGHGAFAAPFDPSSGTGFVEGNAAQYTWNAVHDMPTLIQDLGGAPTAAQRLDLFFAHLNAGPATSYAYLGNEPSEGAPWAYDYLGRPWRTQAIVRRVTAALYKPTPGGLPGNDDLGQLSSWYVFAALGLYPASPGAPYLVLGSPLFPAATLHLSGRDVTITGAGAGPASPYVQSLKVNGASWTKPWLPAAMLLHGASLRYVLGARPNKAWGSVSADAPPSYTSRPPVHPAAPATPMPAPPTPTEVVNNG